MRSGRRSRVAGAIAAALAAAIAASLIAKRVADGAGPAPSASRAVVRPGAAYRPKSEPLLRAERPELRPSAVHAPLPPRAEGGRTGEEIEFPVDASAPPPALRDDDPDLAALEPERRFAETVWDNLSAPPDARVPEAARLLASAKPEDRALGGVLSFFGNILEGEVLKSVAEDPDVIVPLVVLDWVRDFGTEDQVATFRTAFAAREAPAEELLALASESGGLVGGGRSALDLWLAGFAAGEVPAEALADLVASPGASYDVREQALFKLLEPETREVGEAALRALAEVVDPEDDGLLAFAAAKLADLAAVSNPDGDDEKIWDAEAPVVFFLSQAEGGLAARDLANYLEYALRRDDPEFPPIVELGTWEFANDFLLEARGRLADLPASEIDALDRLASSLDRLVEYDPAFNPFETVEDGDVEVSGEDSGDED